MKFGYDTYLSRFTWRYGSQEMRCIFSEIENRTAWRAIWLHLAEAQASYGLISPEELADIRSKSGREHINLKRSQRIEKRIRHDLMAEIEAFAEQCPVGGGKIHLGATSMDIEDNADILRMRNALDLILTRLVNLIKESAKNIRRYRDLPCMGWTHLQPAEPTTLGYRLANYAYDLVLDTRNIENLLLGFVKGKGIKGAVGTSASFAKLLRSKGKPIDLETMIMKKLGIEAHIVSSQVYTRKIDYLVLTALASCAQSAHKFGLDLRVLQSPVFGELSEPRRQNQVGSSAMPFKQNPISAERMCSLARFVGNIPEIAWANGANNFLERTLDDSASRNLIIPEAFLAADEMLMLYSKIMTSLKVYPRMIKKNLDRFGPFSGTESVLLRLVEKGESRQRMHEHLRKITAKAWEKTLTGENNPLIEMLEKDKVIGKLLSATEIGHLLYPEGYLGDAPERCDLLVKQLIEPLIEKYRGRIGKTEQPKF